VGAEQIVGEAVVDKGASPREQHIGGVHGSCIGVENVEGSRELAGTHNVPGARGG
jgi:hypothetical protein